MNSEPPVDKDAESYQVLVLKRRTEEQAETIEQLQDENQTLSNLVKRLRDDDDLRAAVSNLARLIEKNQQETRDLTYRLDNIKA